MPPMHPNCRSDIQAWLGEDYAPLRRRARNPETGKSELIPNMSYKEWLKLQEDENNQNLFSNKTSNPVKYSTHEIYARALTLLPQKLLDAIGPIDIIRDNSVRYSSINAETLRITLGYGADEYHLIHELAHKLEIEQNLRSNTEFMRIFSNKFAGLTKKDYELIDGPTGKYWVLKDTTKFVSPYQTRLYKRFDSFNLFNRKPNLDFHLEYFSEGVRMYYKNPNKLAKTDIELYNFINKYLGR